jgi:hypothetical protein
MRGKPGGRWGQLSRIERTQLPANTADMAIRINRLAAGFVVLAQQSSKTDRWAPIGFAKSNMTFGATGLVMY